MKCQISIAKFDRIWYYAVSYTTDGSGINHMEYNSKEPTVWAKESGRLGSFLMNMECL